MTDHASTFALFRVAAGPRLGFGHLRRATVLANALGRPCAISVRGAAVPARDGQRVPRGAMAAMASVRPRLVVIDDPHAAHAAVWVRAARRAGVPSASLHDLGLARVASTLAVDGSIVQPQRWPADAVLCGLPYAVLDPRVAASRRPVAARVARVVISLGGGTQWLLVRAIVAAVRQVLPDVALVVPAGLHAAPPADLAALAGVEVVVARAGLVDILVHADLAVLAGGVTLYEAVACGVPVVAVPIVAAQRPTVRAFGRRGLAVAVAPGGSPRALARRVAEATARLAHDLPHRRALARSGPRAIDGRGAPRVARALVRLAGGRDA